MKIEKAIFAGGCFWHIQDAFSEIPGVTKVLAGYTGGNVKNPTYEQVSNGDTGHVEAVQVEYDRDSISYDKLLEEFFKMHDPTTVNKQGLDIGNQYNSVIFYYSFDQKEKAEEYKQKLINQGIKVMTKIIAASEFYPAEEYHQNYFKKHNIKGGGCPI